MQLRTLATIACSLPNAIAIALVACLQICTTHCRADEPEYPYAIFLLDGLGNFADYSRAVNNHGVLAGASYPKSLIGFNPTVDNGEFVRNLGTFGGPDGMAEAINASGTIAGWAHDGSIQIRAFIWDDVNGMQDLGSLGGIGASARGINDSNQVVGVTDIPGDDTFEAFIWDDGLMNGLGYLDDSKRSRANAINNNGVVVGESRNVSDTKRPVMWLGNEIIDLGSLGDGSNPGEAYEINDSNEVVGYSDDDNEKNHPFLWKDGVMYRLTDKPGHAKAINNSSQVVGAVTAGGFIWEQGKGFRFLNDLKPPQNDWFIVWGAGISDTGYIAAEGRSNQNKHSTSFLLVPVNPELTLSDPLPGIAGQKNTWTITNAPPNAKITLTYSLKGGGTVVPGCDKLDAVLQLNKPKIIKTTTADPNGTATFKIFVPAAAANLGPILLQAVSVGECQESQLTTYDF